jgi:hypothetical protein
VGQEGYADAVDYIVNCIDDMCWAGEWNTIDAIMHGIDLERAGELSYQVVVFTRWAKHECPSWYEFRDHVWSWMSGCPGYDWHRVNDLFSGLD